ncbi:amidohydrolase family protein [Streptomyces sp. NPDC006739]|uniref:amidohydrolase family protein n=1 Tax=Streptomyces sp. NPDC006739 TaxID=3364763 RepID=UPI0036C6418E
MAEGARGPLLRCTHRRSSSTPGTVLPVAVAVALARGTHAAAIKGYADLDAATVAAVTAQAYRAGVDVCTGTDHETDSGDPFPALYGELDFLVDRCGIPAADVLRSATLVGARAAGTEADTGTVEPGKLADFAVLEENSLQDIGNLRTITLTVRRGRRFDRAEFEKDAQ